MMSCSTAAEIGTALSTAAEAWTAEDGSPEPPPQAASRTTAHAEDKAAIEKRWMDELDTENPFCERNLIILNSKSFVRALLLRKVPWFLMIYGTFFDSAL